MRIVGSFNTTGDATGPQLPDNVVSQSFVAADNDLFQIEVMTDGEGPSREVPLSLTLVEESSNLVVATSSAVVEVGQLNFFTTFEFQPIKNSSGKKYLFTVSSPKTSEPIFLKKASADFYAPGKLVINGQEQNPDLVFRTFHPIVSYKGELLKSIPSHWDRDPLFLSLFAAIILILLGMVVWQSIQLFAKAIKNS